MAELAPIRPLFTLSKNSEQMGLPLIAFTRDDYNKELGSALRFSRKLIKQVNFKKNTFPKRNLTAKSKNC